MASVVSVPTIAPQWFRRQLLQRPVDAYRVALGRNLYYPPRGVANNASLANGVLSCAPIDLTIDMVAVVTAITWKLNTVGSAGALWRTTIHCDDGTGTQPGALWFDSGTVAADSGTGVKTVTPALGSLVLYSGRWWVGGVVQGAPATPPVITTVNNNSGIALPQTTNDPGSWSLGATMSAVTGTPTDFSTTPGYTGTPPRLCLRLN